MFENHFHDIVDKIIHLTVGWEPNHFPPAVSGSILGNSPVYGIPFQETFSWMSQTAGGRENDPTHTIKKNIRKWTSEKLDKKRQFNCFPTDTVIDRPSHF